MKKIVIIGSGMASYLTAIELRKTMPEAEITILTHDDGVYYSKPLLSVALAQGKTPDTLVIATKETMIEKYQFDVRAHTMATQIDAHKKQVLTDKGIIEYDKCIIATGSTAVSLPFMQDTTKLFSVNALQDYRIFRQALSTGQHVAVIGSGLVGVEFAHDLKKAGFSVSLIGDAMRPLDTLVPHAIGDALLHAMESIGIECHMDTRVQAVSESNSNILLTLSNGLEIQADVGLSAVGIRPNITLAQSSGLSVEKGIVVDAYCQTSAPDVYALGDCAQVLGMTLFYVPPIRQCAAALAQTLNDVPTKVTYPAMPVTVKSPSCPVVSCPPRTANIEDLTLEVSGDSPSLTAIYHDQAGNIQGFALSGAAVSQKMALAGRIAPWR